MTMTCSCSRYVSIAAIQDVIRTLDVSNVCFLGGRRVQTTNLSNNVNAWTKLHFA
jgi:hypothetical protein